MPVYVYQVIREGPCGAEESSAESAETAETFEVRQSIHDPPLTRHPVTGEPVRRVPCVPTIAKGAPSNSELANAA